MLVLVNFEAFKKACEKALKEGADKFEFDGNVWLTSYAKHLIQYIQQNKTD